MSLDKTLKQKSALARHRNVLSRAERIEKLKDLEKWEDDSSPFGLPKVGNRKVAAGKGTKKKKEEESKEETSEE